jgi:hypothetical protein
MQIYDDYYLLRFLRARKFNMDNTKLMFNNFLTWRKENDVDNIMEVSSYSISFIIKTNQYRTLHLMNMTRSRSTTLTTIIRLTEREDLSI